MLHMSSFFFVALRPDAYPFLMFLDHTQRRTTFGRTPLHEWSARRWDLYLTTHNTHNKQTSMPPVGFEPTISAGERPQTYALNRAATGTGHMSSLYTQKGEPEYCGQYSNAMDILGFESGMGRDFFLFRSVQTVSSLPPSFIINWYRCTFTGVKRPKRDVDHSPPSIYTFMTWRGKTLTLHLKHAVYINNTVQFYSVPHWKHFASPLHWYRVRLSTELVRLTIARY